MGIADLAYSKTGTCAKAAALSLQASVPLAFALASLVGVATARADEGGVSFWLPGQYGSFAAVAPTPGFALPFVSYYYQGSAGASTPLQRGGTLDFGVDGK